MKTLTRIFTSTVLTVAVLALATADGHADEAGSSFQSPINNIGSIAVKANDPAQAGQFFAEVLEFDRHSANSDLGVEYFQLPSGQYLRLISPQSSDADVYERPVIGFGVDNLDEARKTFEANGLAFEGETVKTPSDARAVFEDIDGNLTELVQNPPLKPFDQGDKELQVTAIGWVGIDVDDHTESFQFFNSKLGFSEVPLPGLSNPYTLMGFDDLTFFEVLNTLGSDYPVVAFQVDNSQNGGAILKQRVVKLSGGIGGNPGLAVQSFESPDGSV